MRESNCSCFVSSEDVSIHSASDDPSRCIYSRTGDVVPKKSFWFKKKIHPWSDALVISYLNYLTYRAYDYLPGLFLEQYFGLKTRGLKRQSSHWRTMGTSSIRLAKFQLFTWYLASLFFLPSILLYSFLHLLFRVLFFMIFFYDILFNNLFNICRFVRIGPYSH